MSEAGATSDRFAGKRRKALKRTSNFRQVCREKPKSCQKKEQLKTGLQLKTEKLSRERAT